MDLITFLVTAIVLFFCAIPLQKWYSQHSKLAQLVNKLPGVTSYPIIGTTWQFFGVPRHKIFNVVSSNWARFPHIYRMWMGIYPEIRIAKAEYVEKILSTTKHIEKSYAYEFVRPWLGDGLLISKGSRWHKHRKIITPTFHFSILDGFCDVFAEQSEVLVNQLAKHAGTGAAFDICPFITRAALDIINETAMGTKINAQQSKNNEYVNAIYEMSELSLKRIFRPWLHPDIIYKYTEPGKRNAQILDILHRFTSNVIEERKRSRQSRSNANTDGNVQNEDDIGKKQRLAFLDLLLDAIEGGQKLTMDDLRQEVDTFMFEGHDTTTSGISWTLFCVGNNPEVQEKIAEEMDTLFGGSDRPATIKDLNEMKYLERVIKESMRMYPPVPFIGRITSEEVEIAGYQIPKNCFINIEIFKILRDPDHFPNPEKFDPDRFLPENSNSRHPYAYIPFSAGPRNCIGQKFALLEEKSVISSILRNYKVKSTQKPEDLSLMLELILRSHDGLNLIIEKRT